MTFGGSLGALEDPRGPREVPGHLWGLSRPLLAMSYFTFQGGEFVDRITKYCHSRFGHNFWSEPRQRSVAIILPSFPSLFSQGLTTEYIAKTNEILTILKTWFIHIPQQYNPKNAIQDLNICALGLKKTHKSPSNFDYFVFRSKLLFPCACGDSTQV